MVVPETYITTKLVVACRDSLTTRLNAAVPPHTDQKMTMVSTSSAQLTTYYRQAKLIRKRFVNFKSIVKTIVCT